MRCEQYRKICNPKRGHGVLSGRDVLTQFRKRTVLRAKHIRRFPCRVRDCSVPSTKASWTCWTFSRLQIWG